MHACKGGPPFVSSGDGTDGGSVVEVGFFIFSSTSFLLNFLNYSLHKNFNKINYEGNRLK